MSNVHKRIVLANHWLITYRGGEKVFGELRRLFPDSDVATLVFAEGQIPDWILLGSRRSSEKSPSLLRKFRLPGVIASPLQWIPWSDKLYKLMLPLHAWAFATLKVPPETSLVLSSDAAMIKGLTLPRGARQICYCHSPPRYLWDLQDVYAENGGLGGIGRTIFKYVSVRARTFDYNAAQNVHFFIANSRFVAGRIERFYGRTSEVIYPPVAVDDFSPFEKPGDFYLLVTQLTPYKRADVAVRAFTLSGRKLIVIGEGEQFKRLKKIAGPNVVMMGRQPFGVVKEHFERCRAFLYPQVEDFGITAVEAQAAGRPVIAFRAGGALETVIDGETGLFFDDQTPEALNDAVHRFEELVVGQNQSEGAFSPVVCRRNAERFGPERFRDELRAFLEKNCPDIFKDYSWPSVTSDDL